MEVLMSKHECIIGLLHHNEYSELVTLTDLKKHIKDQIEFNQYLDEDPIFRDVTELRAKVWTLKNYGDWRKSTDLTRFCYCPECGTHIDWRTIRRSNND
jgi:hypothetical protein